MILKLKSSRLSYILVLIHEARAFNLTYRYIDDVLSINNSRFAEFLPLIYPPELEVKSRILSDEDVSFLKHDDDIVCNFTACVRLWSF
jgi:hypothetical protein